ncbi:MAG: heavy-metal-associated domain-containing protein [Flavobacteriales bacterium]|nr:heavy-metal-associated domain-containing protein [Flavobacteriales bacterium]
MKKILIALFSILTINAWAQKETVQIKTSAECVVNCCKDRIEEEMQFTKGVTAVNLNIESQVLTVTFKTKKNSVENIRTIISNLGYNADDVMANESAHNALPNCCQSLDFSKPKVKKFQLKKPD